MLCEKTSGADARTTSSASGTPRKSGVSTSTAQPGLRSWTASTTRAQCRAPPSGRSSRSTEVMGLRHAVITSVDRDDLPDGGARHWARVVEAVHERNPGCAVEVLTPDFRGVPDALDVVLGAAPEVFSHNVETVPRLYRQARPGSRYDRSLGLLAEAARRRGDGHYAERF